jgi:hypothetical protein
MYVAEGLTIGTAPPGALLRMGSWKTAQPELIGPTTPITLGLATYVRALAVHLTSSFGLPPRAPSHTWRPTR